MPITNVYDLLNPQSGISGFSGFSGKDGASTDSTWVSGISGLAQSGFDIANSGWQYTDGVSGTMVSGFDVISGQISGQNDSIYNLSGYVDNVSGYASGISGYLDQVSGLISGITISGDITCTSLTFDVNGWTGRLDIDSTTGSNSGGLIYSGINPLADFVYNGVGILGEIWNISGYASGLSGYIDTISGYSSGISGYVDTISGYASGIDVYAQTVSGVAASALLNAIGALSGAKVASGIATSGLNKATSGWTYSSGISGYASGISGLVSGLTTEISGLSGWISAISGIQPISGASGWSGYSGWSGLNGASTQTILYFNHSNSDISTYESLTVAPASGVQVDEVTTLTNANTEYLIDAYATASGYPNTTLLLAGLWQFSTYNYLGSAGGTTKIYSRVYKRTSSGVETEIFTTSGNAITITGQTVANYVNSYTTTSDTLLDPADRLIVKLYGTSTQAGKDLHFVYDGNVNNSRVYTPITSRISTDLIWTYISGMSGNTFFLNQATPQFVVSGTPVFRSGLDIGSSGSGSNLTTYATLGSELAPAFSDASWNYQTSWSQLSGVITKVSGAGIAYNYSFLPTIGQTYKIVVNVPTWTGTGNLAVNLGSYVNGTNNGYISGSGTWTFYQTAYSTTGFQLVPSINNVQCTINLISVKKLTDNTGDIKVAGDIYLGSAIKSFGGSADAIFIGANGNVGIKNSQPVYPLDVVGNARCSTQLVQEGTTNTILLDTNSFYGRNIQLASNYTLAWSNTTSAGATMDTGVSRVAAGIVGIGSGNQGGVGGTLQVTTISGAGVINFGKYYVSGVSGWTGSFSTSGGQTVSVLNGIITGVA